MSSIPYYTVQERIRERYVNETEIIQRLREETAALPRSNMLLDPESGTILAVLTRAINPERTLDIGVFTGFSSLTVTLNAPHAHVIALDIDAETTNIARRYWEEAGVADRIDLRIAPALESLDALIHDGQSGTFDFAFIDADKPGYPDYVDRVIELLRPRGTMLLDNMLRLVLDEPHGDAELLDQLTRRMVADERLTTAVLPLGSGMTVATKNG
ncbi:MAG TPA: class I SAM-dependent methyltransferase [Thermomicrobiales bacterium]|nr:class I SAM-dependent methyltransferase [Thermomicrobiales bacterium]